MGPCACHSPARLLAVIWQLERCQCERVFLQLLRPEAQASTHSSNVVRLQRPAAAVVEPVQKVDAEEHEALVANVRVGFGAPAALDRDGRELPFREEED